MKALVCDPVCALPFGHNAPTLGLFGHAMRRAFQNVVMVCSRHLPSNIVENYGFEPVYDFYYHEYIPLPDDSVASASLRAFRCSSYADPLEASATDDAAQLLGRHPMTPKDAIVFPGVDFYGAIGLFNVLTRKPSHERPRILMRFIGVMEGASKFYRDPLTELAWRIKDAVKAGLILSLSAETPKLADDLSERFGIDVSVTPYPDVHAAQPYPNVGAFNVLCPGSARADKGFFELLDIFTEIRRQDRDMSIRFTTQSLSKRDAPHFQKYISQIYSLPGVRLLPSAISDEQMRAEYLNCSLVLLPYDRKIYALRGSASMMEAVTYARPILTYSESAFAEQVSWYRIGSVVETREQMISAILNLACQPREDLERRALRGRRAFLSDVEQAYRQWLMVAA